MDSQWLADPSELRRSDPHLVLYDPTAGHARPWSDPEFYWLNEHILVQEAKDGSLLATWTSERLKPHLLRVAYCRSEDGGRTWTAVRYLDGTGLGEGYPAAWQALVVSHSGRIYVFYTYGKRGAAPFFGGCRCRTSDDHGRSWSGPVDLGFARSPIDDPDPKVPPVWICCSGPHRDVHGRVRLPFTRWARNGAILGGDAPIKERYSHVEILCIQNLDQDPEPLELCFRWLNVDYPITVPHATIAGASFAQEPYLANLPDDRMFMVIRTNRGEAWYTVSDRGGTAWREAEPMLTRDGGPVLQQPASPCSVFSLTRGDYLFLFNDNDGSVFGAEGVWDVRNRRPAYLCRGEFRAGANQPIWWSEPKLFIDNGAMPWGPPGLERLEAAAYCSFTESGGERVLWYPDRKGFLLGKLLTDAFLDGLDVPKLNQ